MKPGDRVKGRDSDGTVTRVRDDGSVVVRWDRLVVTTPHAPGCACGRHGRTRSEELSAARAAKLVSVRR